ncbi:MAG: type VI secretion system tip protein TssI/VgrG [Paracoccus sp. (in: a-proteobacteria)]
MPTDRFASLTTPLDGEDALASIQMADFTGLSFLALRGHDALSRCFEFHVSAISGSAVIKASALLGTVACVSVQSDRNHSDRLRHFHGIVDRFSFDGSDEQGHWLYSLVLRPRMWMLGKATDNRIFQSMSVKDIVSKVLDQHGCTDYVWDLRGTLPIRDYCVQYGETDLDFVQRLLEHEGIFYFFRFQDDKHILVLCDDLQALEPAGDVSELAFRETNADQYAGGGVISEFRCVEQIVPGSHSLTDYDFEKPPADLMAKSDTPKGHDQDAGARFSYPGRYVEQSRGDALAAIRNQEDQVHARVISARSTAAMPAAGNIFDLVDFPRAQENRTYVIERAEYTIRGDAYRSRQPAGARAAQTAAQTGLPRDQQGAGFAASYVLVPQDTRYRPPRVTPRPVMKGPQTAVVVGPAGEEIYTDKYSRVKVQFHWDRQGKKDANTTCFIRVSSTWAGTGWGFIQIPRIGQEVIVDFLEGDPDQPIITGRVYNADQMPPYGLPGSATQSGWKSNSTPGGGGWNELRFEDKKGSEEVYFQAEKDHNELVKNNESRHIGNDWVEAVVHDATQSVGHDRTESVDNNKSTTVGVDRTVSIGNNDTESVGKNRSLSVGVDETISVGSNSTETIGANHSQTVGANQSVTVAQVRTDSVGATETRTVGAAQTMTIGAERTVTVGAAQIHAVGGDDTWSVGGNQSSEIGNDSSTSVGKSKSEEIGESLSIDAGKNVVVKAGDSITLTCGDAKFQMKKDGTIVLEGKDISVKGSGKIGINASSDVTIKGSKISQN